MDYVGNESLMGENGVLRLMASQQNIPSMILWGPPGCGKTSLVHVLSHSLDTEIIVLSAINAGVKDIKQLAQAAQEQQDSMFAESATAPIVFVDEIHRFNKAQQDAFLPFVEAGTIRLIGATTENPAFSINHALLSRMRVFTLEALDATAMNDLCKRALSHLNANNQQATVGNNSDITDIHLDDDAKNALIVFANGDARRLLNTIELAASLAIASSCAGKAPVVIDHTSVVINHKCIEQAAGETVAAFDKQGDHYYDLLSAFHKSIRGSATDAALYWFARMLVANTDVTPICRRLLAIASEDIGNGDPKALQVCLNAWDIYHRVGQAEGERAIAQAVIYCALAPKSNAVYNAFKAAKRDALKFHSEPVPHHLRNAPTKLAKAAGHGKDYAYAHDYPNAYVTGVDYFPARMKETVYYQPNPRGFEKQLLQKIAYLKNLEDNDP